MQRNFGYAIALVLLLPAANAYAPTMLNQNYAPAKDSGFISIRRSSGTIALQGTVTINRRAAFQILRDAGANRTACFRSKT